MSLSADQREAIAHKLAVAMRTQAASAAAGETRLQYFLADVIAPLVDGWLGEARRDEQERIAEIVRGFPLNICGDGSPMPRDHAATVEQFREAVLGVIEGSEATP